MQLRFAESTSRTVNCPFPLPHKTTVVWSVDKNSNIQTENCSNNNKIICEVQHSIFHTYSETEISRGNLG